jgi:acetolactate synthase regulatory subunit
VYEIKEGGLIKLPKSAREIIVALGVSVFTSNLVIEQDREQFETNDSLRSPTYLYNLLEKLGDKKCSLCNCEIPQIIQGAHIYPVASIKRANNLSQNQKLDLAIDGDNGIWLCNNHHKLFDINVLYIASDGRLKQKIEIEINHEEYIKDITINRQLSTDTLTPKFINYLNKRNRNLNVSEYSFVV